MQLQTLLPIVLLVGVFYLLILRPARTRQKAQQETLSSLAVGKTIMTTGGLFGTVTAVNGDRIELEIADGVRVEYLQAAVSKVVPDPEPDDLDAHDDVDDDDAAEEPTGAYPSGAAGPVDLTKPVEADPGATKAAGGDTQTR